MEGFNFIQFYNSFATEEQCQNFLFEQRWSNGVVCPKCGEIDVKTYKLKSGRLKCASCRNTFTVRMGSVFEESPVPLQKWFLAIYLCTSLKKGLSSIQLSKYIGVTQKTAWFMLQRIRRVFESGSFEKLSGEVEMDEAYIGGADKHKHHSKKLKTLTSKGAQGFGSKNSKAPVVGMVERGGRLRAIATKDTGSNIFMPLARNNIDIEVTIYTDEHMPYRTLPKLGFKHESVNHGVKEFVNGMASTNTAEGFWSHLKRGINGIYHHVNAKHLQFYCDEYGFRWNTREMTDGERLSYKSLIEKA